MSKYQFRESDIYLPGTNIPRNRMDITDPELLHVIEEELLQTAFGLFLADMDDTLRFDEAYFKALHRQTFSALYEWAGEYRIVNMGKGDSLFCQAEFLPKESKRIFQRLEHENFLKAAAGWSKGQFADQLAYVQCELIALHPFYELNGRITRLFFDLIAVFNGYDPIDYSHAIHLADKNTSSYIQASIECVQQANNTPLRQIIFEGLKKSEGNP